MHAFDVAPLRVYITKSEQGQAAKVNDGLERIEVVGNARNRHEGATGKSYNRVEAIG